MATKKYKLTVHVTLYDDGAKFYEWEMAGVDRDKVKEVMKSLAEDIGGEFIITSEKRVPKEDI